ncbi:MAG: AsmA family protein [Gammaproteobacteria bacterium]|nr:MAG: AsmA family protein [Gammaproteobacteria bacterium]
MMKRFFKYTGIALGLLVLLAIVLLVCLATFVNPNQLKSYIINKIHLATGRELTIDGDLSWTLFPSLGVKVGHMVLSNPASFKQPTFAEIESATVSVKLFPLLHRQIESDGVEMKGMKLYLIRQANGQTNWQMGGTSTTSSSTAAAAFGLAVSNVTVSNAAITWQDEQSKQFFAINQFELHAKDIHLSQPFPIKISFQMSGKNPTVATPVTLSSDITLDFVHQALSFADLTAQVANMKLAGKVDVTQLSNQPHTTGHLQVLPFDVKEWLRATGQDAATLQVLKELKGEVDFSAGTTLQSVRLQGDMKVDDVRASNIQLSDVNVHTQMTNGVLALSPITAAFYQGTLQGQAKVDLNQAVPQLRLQATLANVQMEALMKDMGKQAKLTLSGTGNIDLQVTTSGANGNAVMKNLNGTGHVSLKDGAIKGIDIPYLLDHASSMIKHQTSTRSNTHQTPFGALTASLNIRNGVIFNDDLFFDTPVTDTKGHGQIDLVQQQIKYQLETTVKGDGSNLQNLYGLTIPISITGKLSDPLIQVDASEVVKQMAKQRLEEVKSKLQDRGVIGPGLRLRRREILNNLLNR